MKYVQNIKRHTTKSFPNDEKIRVVWAQPAIYKNLNGTTNVPNVEIMSLSI